jgi:uncharacterized membrane protein
MPQDYEALERLTRDLAAGFDKEKARTLKLISQITKHKLVLVGTRKKLLEVVSLAKKMEETRHEIKSQDQTITRLERQIEILQKEIGELKKSSLTEADIKPFKKLLK